MCLGSYIIWTAQFSKGCISACQKVRLWLIRHLTQMTWFWQRKSDKQAECDTSLALWLPPKTFSNPILIRCMCKQLMCHALNKQRLVFCELIAPKIHSDCPVLSTGRDVKDGWVPHVMDHRPSAFGCPSPADSHLLKSSRWGSHCSTTPFHPLLPAEILQTSAWDAASFLHLSWMDTPNQKAGCHHWNGRLWILQWKLLISHGCLI